MFLDAIALSGLVSTPEVGFGTLGAAVGLFALSRLIRSRLPDRWAMIAFGSVFAGACGIYWTQHWAPLVVAANVAPFVQATIWFCADTPRWRNWRLSIAFLELILAASISPDFYISILIFLFISVAIFRLMISYTEEWCQRSQVAVPPRLPRTLIASSGAAIVLMLITGAIIFPFLPRMAGQIRGGVSQGQVGYTEEVNVSDWLKMSGQGGGDTLVRVYLPSDRRNPNEEIADYLYGGLLRAKVLDHFDGVSWKPATRRQVIDGAAKPKLPTTDFQDVALELIREPMNSLVLPVPYGARDLTLAGDMQPQLPRIVNSEYVDESSYDKRMAYTVHLAQRRGGMATAALPHDLPIIDDLHVPGSLDNERMQKLTREIFGKSQDPVDKAQRLRSFFQNYSGSVSGETLPTDKIARARGFSAIERFIFMEKQGHCELFSSAGAVLLRLAGVPARMVAGFRVTHGTSAGVLNLRQGDAHAWLEFWDPAVGWRALDLTPRSMMPGSMLATLQDWYDRVSGLWFKYVLSYESLSDLAASVKSSSYAQAKQREVNEWSSGFKDSLLKNFDIVVMAGVMLILLLVIAFIVMRSWFPWIFSIRMRVRQGPRELSRERALMERWVHRQLNPWQWLWTDRRWPTLGDLRSVIEERWGTSAASEFEAWAAGYQSLRFGHGETKPTRDELHVLREKRKRFAHALLTEYKCS
jgi:transglutaminase-like putative cysteine protease